MVNTNKIKAKFAEKGLSIPKVAKEIPLDQSTLHKKINGKSDFSVSELLYLRNRLEIFDNDEFLGMFFAE